jgi:exo-1,4-beta-D-glucosaminidase
MAYENIRAMFEAYSRNKYSSTGIIQWMLNNAWPSIIWHLYDYYLQPAGGYFGAKKACEPIHAQYDYDDHSVSLVSSQYNDAKGLKVTAKVYDLDLSEKFSKEVTVDAAADSTERLFQLPPTSGLTSTYFLKLTIADSSSELLSSNFYWLSTKPDVSKWKKSTWYYTPIESYADLTALKQLPKANLKVSSTSERQGEEEITRITLENSSKTLAFFLRVKLAKGPGGAEVLPILYEDNYFSLMPGDRKEITATYHARNLEGAKPTVEIAGWNVEPASF